MSKILKNLKVKMFFILCIFTILFSSLLRIYHTDLLTVFRGIYGGIALNAIFAKMGFVLFIILLQYINAEVIIYYLNNASYLSIRYGSKERLMRVLFKKILVLNFIFVCLSGVGAIFSAALNGLSLSEMSAAFLEVLLRGYLTCLIISIIQIFSLIKTTETNTFLVMMGLSIALIFLSQIQLSFFTILPIPLDGLELLFNIAICILIIIFGAVYVKETFSKKEIC